MNANDSDWLTRSLLSRGFTEAPFDEASLYILNTCSVRDKAEQKVYSELGRIARHCKVHGRTGVTVCVGGCVAQQAGEKLARRFKEVRLVFGTDGIARAPEAIERLMESPRLKLKLLDFAGEYEERFDPRLNFGGESPGGSAPGNAVQSAAQSTAAATRTASRSAHGPLPRTAPPSAFVNIMQGCDNFCTYCIVPYVRGRQKSRSPDHVLAECRALVDGGAREITLLGQNVNSYGLDAKTKNWQARTSFADLLHKVASISGLERLRFVTPHPKDIAPEVVDAFGSLPALCPRLHLPLQSGSDAMLKAMNRRYDMARYMDIVTRLKKARPDIVLTTDIIVGFPGESEEDFEATMRAMREVGFASSFSFVYSDRPGAKAVLFGNKIARSVALERLSRLQAWQNQASDSILTSQIGADCTILLEARSRLDSLLKEGAPAPGLAARENASSADSQADASLASPAAATANSLHSAADSPAPAGQSRCESWQGKTPHGFIVNVELEYTSLSADRDMWTGKMLPVHIEAAARHSLKGRQAGLPW